MVYKKYIKKDGKLYGPYIYESKRVGGKVISEYHGPKKIFEFKKYAWIFVSIAFVLFLAYFLATFDFSSLTGQAVLSTEVNYTQNKPIKGNLAISLKEGELLPLDSKLILENSGQIYEYDLNKLISNQVVEGSFYIEGISLSGQGEGYGIEGEKTIYPDVSFVLNIYPVEANVTTPPEEPEPVSNETNIVNETYVNETQETPVINETGEVPTNNETYVNETQETPTVNENTGTTEINNESETSPITGFFIRIYNFFLGLTPTGRAISETGIIEINGQASFNNPFTYELSGGEGVQLKPGSVSVSSSGNVLPDDVVSVKVEGAMVMVETSYSETEKGFGEEFLGDNAETLNINLSALGLVLNEGELTTKIVYGNNEIISNSVTLISGSVESNLTNVLNSTTLNITIEQPLNKTLNDTIGVAFGENIPQIITADTVKFILTEDEKALLSEEYGEIVVQTTKSEIINGRLVKRYEIGNDWIEYSYDITLSEADVEYQMSIDRMKWLKDLAQRIRLKKQAAQQTQPQPVENFSVE